MKKNTCLPVYPPETAPKDNYFLGDFGIGKLMVTVWNAHRGAWCMAMMSMRYFPDNSYDVFFDTKYLRPESLRGWHPMIDDTPWQPY